MTPQQERDRVAISSSMLHAFLSAVPNAPVCDYPLMISKAIKMADLLLDRLSPPPANPLPLDSSLMWRAWKDLTNEEKEEIGSVDPVGVDMGARHREWAITDTGLWFGRLVGAVQIDRSVKVGKMSSKDKAPIMKPAYKPANEYGPPEPVMVVDDAAYESVVRGLILTHFPNEKTNSVSVLGWLNALLVELKRRRPVKIKGE